MKLSEMAKEMEKTTDILLPDRKMIMCIDYARPDSFIGPYYIDTHFCIEHEEWADDTLNDEDKAALITTRIKSMLYEIRDKINKDIERIENHGAT